LSRTLFLLLLLLFFSLPFICIGEEFEREVDSVFAVADKHDEEREARVLQVDIPLCVKVLLYSNTIESVVCWGAPGVIFAQLIKAYLLLSLPFVGSAEFAFTKKDLNLLPRIRMGGSNLKEIVTAIVTKRKRVKLPGLAQIRTRGARDEYFKIILDDKKAVLPSTPKRSPIKKPRASFKPDVWARRS
jgi:hypothetical protein